MKRHLLTLVLLLLAASAVLLTGCGGGSGAPIEATDDFYVYDGAGVLSDATESHILALNESLCSQTGAQVVVACVDSTGSEDIADYAYELFNGWGIGDADKDNGLLLLLSIEEEDYWALQGSGLENILSSGALKLMLDDYLEPNFAVGRYDAGVRKVFDAAVSHLADSYGVTVQDSGGLIFVGPEEDDDWEDWEDWGDDWEDDWDDDEEPGGFLSLGVIFTAVFALIKFGFKAVGVILAIAVIVVIASVAAARRRGGWFDGTPSRPDANPNRPRTQVNNGRVYAPTRPTTTSPYRKFTTPTSTSRPTSSHGSFGGSRPTGGRTSGGGGHSSFGGSGRTGGHSVGHSGGRSSFGGGGHSRGGGAGRR